MSFSYFNAISFMAWMHVCLLHMHVCARVRSRTLMDRWFHGNLKAHAYLRDDTGEENANLIIGSRGGWNELMKHEQDIMSWTLVWHHNHALRVHASLNLVRSRNVAYVLAIRCACFRVTVSSDQTSIKICDGTNGQITTEKYVLTNKII